MVGTAIGMGSPRPIDPESCYHIEQGSFPSEVFIEEQLKSLISVLENHGVSVVRPNLLSNVEQIFVRDLAVIVGDRILICNCKEPCRREELAGLNVGELQGLVKLYPPPNIWIEGGDVIMHNDFIYVGIGNRTSDAAVEWLQSKFPKKKIVGVRLQKFDSRQKYVLHLDCIFQPIGSAAYLLWKDGLADPGVLAHIQGVIYQITDDERHNLYTNLLMLDESVAVIGKGFLRLKKILKQQGIDVLEVEFDLVQRLGGSFRCATLVIERDYRATQ